MTKREFVPLTPAALYARVSSDRQDVDLSVAAQLRALREYAKANGYSVAREYVDEAESGRIADRPQFREMIDEGSKPQSPFQVILVWKFSRFTRKREHAVAFKAQLRRKGIRVVSITEQAEDNATGRLLEGIIESVDEYYSENLGQEVVRGMREAASRGFFMGSKAPFGYTRIKVSDGVKDRPTLEVDPDTAPTVREIFESSRRGNGLAEICKELNGRGITNKGKRWQKNVIHYLLTNEAYTGTAVWGQNSKDEKAGDPVRVENAWPALVSRETFDLVQQGLHQRAPTVQRPARAGSHYLLSGLLRCGVCGKSYSAQGAKSGQFAYYVCSSLFREGAGACTARYLNATKVEDLVIEKVRERILTEETITELVTLVAEEIDALAGEVNGRLTAINSELSDVDTRLESLYQALETQQLPLEVLSPRILALKSRQDQLTAAREEAEFQLEQRRAELPTSKEIKGYVADFRTLFQEGTFPERKALIRNFVQGIEIVEDEAVLTYTIPMPQDGVTSESAPVLDFVQSGPPTSTWRRQSVTETLTHTSRKWAALQGHLSHRVVIGLSLRGRASTGGPMKERSESLSFRELVRTRNFGLLWGAGGLSAVGDQFDLIAFPWLVLLVTGDPVAVGIVLAVGNVPAIFFMLIGGSLADRYSPRLVMLASNGVRIALVAALAALVLAGMTDLWLIYVFALLKGIADSFHYPAQMAMLPRIVPVELLRPANAAVHTTTQLSGFIGPALAGGLIAFFSGGAASASGANKTGIGLAFSVVALVLLASSVMLLLIRMAGPSPASAGEDEKEPGILSSIREGIQHVRSDGAMLAVFLLIVGMELLIRGPVKVGIPVLAHSRLAEGALALGVVTSAYAGGSVLGTVLAGALPAPKRGMGLVLIAVFTLAGILLMPFGFLSATWLVAAIMLIIGVMGGYVGILIISWIQGRTRQAILGRVMSLLLVASVAVSPISIAASGPLIRLSLEWVFVISGGMLAAFAVAVGLRPEIRGMRMAGNQDGED